ncbi:MAG: murein L,D-transpeptidase, partial [Parascardovia denticolens]
MKSEHGKRKAAPGKKAGIIASIIILALLVALGAGGYGLIDYFRDRVAPGVSLGSTPVTGQDKTQVKKTIRAVASSTKVTIKSNGKSTTASLQDLHVTVDVDKTADSLLQAKQGNPITRLNPQEKSQVGLIAKTDEVSLQSDLNKYFLGAEREVQLPTVSYSSEEGKFVVNAGKNGQSVDLSSVKPAITAALKNKAGGTVSVDAAIKTDVPAISDQTAHGAADQANKNLIRKITITNGAHKSFTLPSSIIAQWTTFT